MNLKITKFKDKLWIFLLCLFLIVVPFCHDSYALTPQQVPNPRQEYGGWVTDMANILNRNTENRLNQIITDLEKQNGVEIAIVTVPTTKPAETPKMFTTKLFNYWGIGKKDKNNGVLFLVSQGERRVEIETGLGMQNVLPDRTVANIIETKIIPQFKQNNFDRGVLNGTQALVIQIKENYQSTPIETLPNQGDQTPIGVTPPSVNREPKYLPNPPIHYLLILLASVVTVIFCYFQLTKIYQEKFTDVIYLNPVSYEKLDIHSSQKYLNEGKHKKALKVYLRLMSIVFGYAIVLIFVDDLLQLYLNSFISIPECITIIALVEVIPLITQIIIYQKYPLSQLILGYILIWVIQVPILGVWFVNMSYSDPSVYHNSILIVGIFFPIIALIWFVDCVADILRDQVFFIQHFLLLTFCSFSYGCFSYFILTLTLERQNNLYIYSLLILVLLPNIIYFLRSDFKGAVLQFFKPIIKLLGATIKLSIVLIVLFWLLQINKVLSNDTLTNLINMENGLQFVAQLTNPINEFNNILLEFIARSKMIIFSLVSIILLTANSWYKLFKQYLPKSKPEIKRPNYHCQTCEQAMALLDSNLLYWQLNKAQKLSQELKLAEFEAWECNSCEKESLNKNDNNLGLSFNLRRYLSKKNISQFFCEVCDEYTLTKTDRVIREATTRSTGEREISYHCGCCQYSHVEYETIAQLDDDDDSSSSFGGGSSSGGGKGGSW